MAEVERALVRLVIASCLRPQADLHASWLPADWPARHRRVARANTSGSGVLADLLRRDGAVGAPWFRFDSRASRLALLDGRALRRLAAYVGLSVHKPLMQARGAGRALRRQARRIDTDADRFVLTRVPALGLLAVDAVAFQARPFGAGRLMLDRGARLLVAALASEPDPVLQLARRKLPRRLVRHKAPGLTDTQRMQVQELVLLCLVPERIAQWDWLFSSPPTT